MPHTHAAASPVRTHFADDAIERHGWVLPCSAWRVTDRATCTRRAYAEVQPCQVFKRRSIHTTSMPTGLNWTIELTVFTDEHLADLDMMGHSSGHDPSYIDVFTVKFTPALVPPQLEHLVLAP
eukprot:GHRQ01028881.1.p2 GENE.GHRQ01028881.1~~GHRQ01028881.1.p2  ORF type:complete len:123 (-),score=6.27 GHRQ01028881.1:116-484(-)